MKTDEPLSLLYLLGGGSQHHSHTHTVHHHRAPTDESIRLANEMREKILSEIVGRTTVETILGKAEIVAQMGPVPSYIVLMNVNGEDMRVTIPLPLGASIDLIKKPTKELIEKIYEAIAHRIAEKLTLDALFNIKF